GAGDVGAPCVLPDECKPGLACFGYVAPTDKSAGVDGTCGAPAAASQPCGAGEGDSGISINFPPFFGKHPECQPASMCTGCCAPRSAEGGFGGFDDECVEGTRCILNKCTTGSPAGAGGACKEPSDCAYPLTCVRGNKADTGTCGTLLPAGSACTSSKECEGL